MQQNFNELYATITNIKPSMIDAPNFSQALFDEEKQRPQNNYRCSLIDIPEFMDQSTFFNCFKNQDEFVLPELMRRQRASIINFSNNSLFNLEGLQRTTNNPASKPENPNQTSSIVDLEGGLVLRNLWNSRRNIFDQENTSDFLGGYQTQSLRPVLQLNPGTPGVQQAAPQPLAPAQTNKIQQPKVFIGPPKPNLQSEHKHPQQSTPTAKKEKVACHCKKSKCLRLYCECFAKGLICGVDCACNDCHNIEDLKDLRELVVQETLEKNPFAFKSKYKKLRENQQLLHSRGCNCSKTGCIKKYCECYNAGTGCSRLCKCSNCQNENIELEDSEVKIYYDRVLRKRSKKSVLSGCFEAKKIKK